MTNIELEGLLRTRIVFDRGQLSEENQRWLAREVKARRVQRLWNTQRGPGAFMYWIAS